MLHDLREKGFDFGERNVTARRQIALILMMTFSCSQSGLAADLSPAKWQPQDRERAEQSLGMGATQREGVRDGSPPQFHPKFRPKTSVDF